MFVEIDKNLVSFSKICHIQKICSRKWGSIPNFCTASLTASFVSRFLVHATTVQNNYFGYKVRNNAESGTVVVRWTSLS